ncbi:secondary thiamine-phosphate synthase enzyme YjbQ [Thalassotalea sp. ND16A]|uniref:secondary thiamine-phosphate synthase enzyme YjbQ n=1 Tax=Thalassotalea sp. ND16A TaxID=1535422 RepID=UPI00051A75E7|nr:secondary thiamine-phosphate synthase enzyme YjbQ [Thalassotalea sp. ND16A]KGJ97715.1 hypothetical protein ND16A_0994 [Thalassotalea sp. ND16A]
MWLQQQLSIRAKTRGFHLIDNDIVQQLPQLQNIDSGLLHLFLQHTSASLTINENADPTVRADLEQHFNTFVPENAPYYQHDYEGPDDMPAHIKSSILGCQLTIPISNGQLALGTWQGIYLGEHRNHAGSRRIIATIHGE